MRMEVHVYVRNADVINFLQFMKPHSHARLIMYMYMYMLKYVLEDHSNESFIF